jgi:DNA-binding response OmpR family regulator
VLAREASVPTILVVEDEPVLAVALEISLQQAGHRVLGPIAHLETALAALTGPPIAALLCGLGDLSPLLT